MGIDLVTELLSAHAEDLNTDKAVAKSKYLQALPDQAAEIEPLLDLAERLKHTLTPVEPTPAFRARLHDGLLMAAHHQATHRILIEQRDEPQWRWLIGAAAIGSAAGLIAFVLRSRAQETRTTVEAPCPR